MGVVVPGLFPLLDARSHWDSEKVRYKLYRLGIDGLRSLVYM